jgi:hypothetical protein
MISYLKYKILLPLFFITILTKQNLLNKMMICFDISFKNKTYLTMISFSKQQNIISNFLLSGATERCVLIKDKLIVLALEG